jgi:predicted HicB family RNase H-like nuclease
MSKKNFKNEFNPAMQFISGTENQEQAQPPETEKTEKLVIPMKRNPLYVETRSKRLQLLMQPSLHKKLKDIADQKQESINEIIHTVLDQYAKKNK